MFLWDVWSIFDKIVYSFAPKQVCNLLVASVSTRALWGGGETIKVTLFKSWIYVHTEVQHTLINTVNMLPQMTGIKLKNTNKLQTTKCSYTARF